MSLESVLRAAMPGVTAEHLAATVDAVRAEVTPSDPVDCSDHLLGPQTDVDDDMCPNCVTPWKCNGPHIEKAAGPTPQAGDQEPAREAGE